MEVQHKEIIVIALFALAIALIALGEELVVEKHTGRICAIGKEGTDWGSKVMEQDHFAIVKFKVPASLKNVNVSNITNHIACKGWCVNPMVYTNASKQRLEAYRVNVTNAQAVIIGGASEIQVTDTNAFYKSDTAHK